MPETIVPICVQTEGAMASDICPEGYSVAHVETLPLSAGDIDPQAAAVLMGAFALFFGCGLILALIKRGI